MPRALVLSEHDLDAYGERFRRGEAPSPLPYGVDALSVHGYELVGVPEARTRVGRKLRDVVEHRSGMVVDRPLRGLAAARRADLVLALLEPHGLVPAILRRRRVPPYSRTPVVLWSCWLADDVRTADAAGREQIRRRVLGADLVTHMSRHETEILIDLGLPEDRLLTIPFGVAHRFYTQEDVTRDIEVLAVGQDRGRDYRTLFDAVRGTDLAVDLVCRDANLRGLDVPPNVTVHPPVPISAYRDLLRRARVVAVPTFDLSYPTGQSVALEASSTGACVVVTGTPAMADYFRDREDARLVGTGNVDGWRDLLTELREDRAQRERLGDAAVDNVASRFNTERMWGVVADGIEFRNLTS